LLDFKRQKDFEDKKFLAAIQGVELNEASDDSIDDIADLKGLAARNSGFGINEGLEIMVMGVDD